MHRGGVLLVAILLNGGYYVRNLDLFGHITGFGSHVYMNEEMNGFALLSNLVRNAASHWGVPNETINALTLDTIRQIFGDLIDNVPGTTLIHSLFEWGIPFSLGEYETGNFLHWWTLAISLPGILLFGRRCRFDPWAAVLALGVVLGTLAFCGIFKWQPWNSRYHTPLFMLGTPLGAIFVAQILSWAGSLWKDPPEEPLRGRPPVLNFIIGKRQSMVAGIFLVLCIPWVISNDTKAIYRLGISQRSSTFSPSIFSQNRTDIYFHNHQTIQREYNLATDLLAAQKPTIVGFYGPRRLNQYPIWPLLRDRLGDTFRIEYVGVTNVSEKLYVNNVAPPFVFSMPSFEKPERPLKLRRLE